MSRRSSPTESNANGIAGPTKTPTVIDTDREAFLGAFPIPAPELLDGSLFAHRILGALPSIQGEQATVPLRNKALTTQKETTSPSAGFLHGLGLTHSRKIPIGFLEAEEMSSTLKTLFIRLSRAE